LRREWLEDRIAIQPNFSSALPKRFANGTFTIIAQFGDSRLQARFEAALSGFHAPTLLVEALPTPFLNRAEPTKRKQARV
jgi:hypothetical protein